MTNCKTEFIVLSLITNEFCINGINNISQNICAASNCIFREHCYQLHSEDYSENEIILNDYPMGYCTESRNSKGIWLKSNFIRPEDLTKYKEIGINHFKITGRTASTEFIMRIIDAYMKGSFNGNLLELWQSVEKLIKTNHNKEYYQYYLNNKKLDGFIDFWFNHEEHLCSNEVCGETCHYCDAFYLSLQ